MKKHIIRLSSEYKNRIFKKEKEFMDNKFSILNNSFSIVNNFSDDMLPKAKIYPIVKDAMWKCVMNFEKPQYASFLIASIFELDYDYVLQNMKETNFVLPKGKVKEASKTVDFVCKIEDEIFC